MAMNLHLLRVFASVAELNSFSRAAERLHVSQPAVSKAVRELEHQLGLPLLERGGGGARGRSVRPTEAGQALHAHARAIFAMERAAGEDMRARLGLIHGNLAVGASTTIAGYWLPAELAAFARRHPGIHPRMAVGNTQAIADAVIDCRIDLALVEGPVDDARIASIPWRDERLRIVAPTQGKRRIGVAELRTGTWLVREPGSGTREVAERLLAAHAIVPQRTIELASNEAIARAVASGMGLALLPTVVSAELVALGRLRNVVTAMDAGFLRPLFLLELRDRPRSPATASFRELLLARKARR